MKTIIKKSIVLFAFACIFSSVSVMAQDLSFQKGNKVVQVGVGIGSNVGLPISAGFEFGLSDKFGLGLTAGFASKDWGALGYKATYIPFGLKGNFHFYRTESLDTYAGAMAGYMIANVKYNNGSTTGNLNLSGIVYGGYAGARYYFTPAIGVFAEAGYGTLGYLTAGVALKF